MLEPGENNLEHLFNKKPFDKLPLEDQQQVLKFLSEEDYTQYQLLLKRSVDALDKEGQDLHIKPSIVKDLRKAFKARHNKKLFLLASFRSCLPQLPLFRTGIAFAVVIVLIIMIVNYPVLSPKKRLPLSAQKEMHNIIKESKRASAEKSYAKSSFSTRANRISSSNAKREAPQNKKFQKLVSTTPTETNNPLCSDIHDVSEELGEQKFYSSNMNPIGMNEKLLMPDESF